MITAELLIKAKETILNAKTDYNKFTYIFSHAEMISLLKMMSECELLLDKKEELNKLLDEVDQFLVEMDSYLNWNTDDLVGDDLIGDQKRTKSFNAKLKMIQDMQAKLKAHRGEK